ncbi:MAG: AAA family ATPase [Acidimicrobiales bacterium]
MANRLASASRQFVGRADELQQLDSAFASSVEGRGVPLVVSGEPGVGKTRFCDELASIARRRGFRVVNGRCSVDAGAPAFWPWQPILRELCGDAAAGLLSSEGGRAAADDDRFVRFQAVTDHVAEVCAQSPVCLVVDDIHAADAGTLLLTRFIARSLPRLALTLVLTRRSGEPADDPDIARLLDDIEAEAVPIMLEPLDLEETAAFLDANGLAGIDTGVASVLHRVTGGNPMFLRRVTALGTPGPDPGSVPTGVRAAIERALARLSPEARRVLQIGAVLDPTPTVATVAAVVGCDPGAVLDAVGEGAVAGLVESEGTSRFAFGHEVIRSAFEDALGGNERLDVHAAAAAVADTKGAASADLLGWRAHHAVAAAPRSPEDARRAVAACSEAAEAMAQSFAYEQADAMLSEAVDLHKRSTIGPLPGGLMVRWAQAAANCGRTNEARARFDRAVTVTRSDINDPVLFAEAALGLGGLGVKERRLPDERARVLGLQRAALAGLPDGAVPVRYRLEARLAAEAVIDGAPLDDVRAAVEAARRYGDPAVLGEALALWHHVVLTPEHTRTRLAIADELIRAAADAGSGVFGLIGLWFRTIDLFHLGDGRAVGALEEVRARASTVASQDIVAKMAVVDAMLLIRSGRLDEAVVAAEHARDLGEAAGEVNALNYYGAQILGIRWIEGRSAEVAELAEQVAALPGVVDSDFAFQATAAAFLANAGRLGRARAMVAELVGDDPVKLPLSSSWLVGMAALADVTAALDDARLARQVYGVLAPYADLPTFGGSAVLCLGSTERALGVASQAFGDLDRAVGHFERAIEENRRLGHLPMAIIAHAELAFALVRRGRTSDRERAADLFDRAIIEASRIEMTVRAATWREARAALSTAPAGVARRNDPVLSGRIHVDGSRWVVALDGRRVRVPNLVGMRYLAELLTRPRQSIPALSLASQGMTAGSPNRQELLDDKARAAYAARARELTSELAEAEANNDLVRAEKIRVELDALVDELEAATGLGGRPRAFTDSTERARSSVSKAVRRAIDAIDDASPAIADALRATISCGAVCMYVPDAMAPVVWSTEVAQAGEDAELPRPAAPIAVFPTPTATIGARGRRAARRWFVGRDEQVDLLRSALASADRPFSVLFVHGPGGVGKTMLLGALAAEAATAGVRVVRLDMHTIEPNSSAFSVRFVAELGRDSIDVTPQTLADAGPIAVLVDTFERAEPLVGWLWDQFVARLQSNALVVIASRNPPPARWRADPSWQALARVVALGNLSAEDTRQYLELRGIEASLHDRLISLTHGHPLALSLVVDVLEQRTADDRAAIDLVDTPDVVRMLVERFVGEIPDRRRREALAVCAHVRFTTEDLLRAAMGGDDAGELLSWLRSLSFVEEGRYGLFPHDVARDVLDTDLRWRDRVGYADVHVRVRRHLVGRIRSLEGLAQQRAAADIIYLHRLNPIMRPRFDWSRLCNVQVDRVDRGERDLILEMTALHQGPAQAEMARHWLDRQPEAFAVFRTDDEVVGYTAILRLHEASPRDIQHDPGALAMWTYAATHDPPRQDEVVTAARFFVDRAEDQVQASPSWDGFTIAHMLHAFNTPHLAWDFIGSWQTPDHEPMMRYKDYHRVSDAEFDIDGRHHFVFAHDWRRRDWEAFIEMMGHRELDDGSGILVPAGVTPPQPMPVLSHHEFGAAVRQALRDRHRPDRLAANLLVRSRSVRARFGADAGATSLVELLDEAADALAGDPRDVKAHRAIDRTYLRPASSQQKAAEVLGLPFGTYRDHLNRGISRIVEQLWHQEVHPVEHQPRTDRRIS